MEKIQFDPGFGPNVADFYQNAENVKDAISCLVAFKQKKTMYSNYRHKLFLLIQNNVAFYLGCLLWAYYLKKTYDFIPREIEGNSFYGLNQEELDDYDFEFSIDYIIEYLNQYEKDAKYYGVTSEPAPEEWKQILLIYKEFLKLNKGFINLKYTNELIIPDDFEKLKFDFDVLQEIQNAVKCKCIENLLDLKIFA